MKIVAFIPIKLNNQRLSNKNILQLGNKPLMAYQQEELLKIKEEFSEIDIYCSDPAVKTYLLPGVNFLQRPKELDGSLVKGNQIYESFISAVDADFYLLDHVTAPFVKASTIKALIDAVRTGNHDSAFAAYKIQKFLWRGGMPLNFDISDVPRTRDLEPIYVDQCGPYLFSKELFLKHRRRIGFTPFIKEMEWRETIDIDTAEEFHLAEKYV